jgi:UDP:flavonoid glycosyltransferase YjiC (YdhE family)
MLILGAANLLSRAGVPQVVLPLWSDTYDFARRAEAKGIGRWGNVRSLPRWSSSELGSVLVDVALDRSEIFTAKARMAAEKSRQHGEGRDLAADALLRLTNTRT